MDDATRGPVPGGRPTPDGRAAADAPDRPRRLVVVGGTGTEVGKTWVACALLREWRRLGLSVAARKPAQSYEVDEDSGGAPTPRTDAERLAAASGEEPSAVCPPHRSYPAPLAPPMAAEALGRPAFCVGDLVSELRWPPERVDVGLVELAGGVASPQACDGDGAELVELLVPDAAVLVADPGLGTINAVRLSLAALAPAMPRPEGEPAPVLVVLDRFDEAVDLHRLNRDWLAEHDGARVLVVPGQLGDLAAALAAAPSTGLGAGSATVDGRAAERSRG